MCRPVRAWSTWPLLSTPSPATSPGSGCAGPRTGSGWRVSRTAQTGSVLDALEQAPAARRPVGGSGLVHHSDRGVPYVSIKYTERLAEAGIHPFVGSVEGGSEERRVGKESVRKCRSGRPPTP